MTRHDQHQKPSTTQNIPRSSHNLTEDLSQRPERTKSRSIVDETVVPTMGPYTTVNVETTIEPRAQASEEWHCLNPRSCSTPLQFVSYMTSAVKIIFLCDFEFLIFFSSPMTFMWTNHLENPTLT